MAKMTWASLKKEVERQIPLKSEITSLGGGLVVLNGPALLELLNEERLTVTKADVVYSMQQLSPSVFDNVGHALLEKFWDELRSNQLQCGFDEKQSDKKEGL